MQFQAQLQKMTNDMEEDLKEPDSNEIVIADNYDFQPNSLSFFYTKQV